MFVVNQKLVLECGIYSIILSFHAGPFVIVTYI